MERIEDRAYAHALAVLRKNATKRGFRASCVGYPAIWARDACVTNLGAFLSGDRELVATAQRSLDTLAGGQTEVGQIPNYLNLPRLRPGFSAADFFEAGATDATLWYILGVYYAFAQTGDERFLRRHWDPVRRAVEWLRCQDVNHCGLIEVAEAGDWTDLFSNRYNILYDEALYFAALAGAGRMARELHEDGSQYARLAGEVKRKVNLLFWVDPAHEGRVARTDPRRLNVYRRILAELGSLPYYLPYLAFMDYGYRCDVYANLLSILFGVCDRARGRAIVRHIAQIGADRPFPVKVLHPPVFEGERDWRDYFRYKGLNLPYQHQNGASWPYVGGFWVAVLAHLGEKSAAPALERLAEANRQGVHEEWEFSERLHGLSGQPLGQPLQAWSAGMYLYAYHALEKKEAPVLGTLST